MGSGTFKHWDLHLPKTTGLVNTSSSTNQASSAQSEFLYIADEDKGPMVHMVHVGIIPISSMGNNPISSMGLFLLKDLVTLGGQHRGMGNSAFH